MGHPRMPHPAQPWSLFLGACAYRWTPPKPLSVELGRENESGSVDCVRRPLTYECAPQGPRLYIHFFPSSRSARSVGFGPVILCCCFFLFTYRFLYSFRNSRFLLENFHSFPSLAYNVRPPKAPERYLPSVVNSSHTTRNFTQNLACHIGKEQHRPLRRTSQCTTSTPREPIQPGKSTILTDLDCRPFLPTRNRTLHP